MLLLSTCTVDLEEGIVTRDGEPVALSARELEVLAFLCANQGRVVSRDELLREVFRHPDDSLSRVVDTVVRRLRVKLEADPARPEHLLTEYGEGYRFRPTPAPKKKSLPRSIALDGGWLCLETGRLDRFDGTAHVLVGVELQLLRVFVESEGQVLDLRVLERRVWGSVLSRSNRLRNLVYRLRSRVELDPAQPRHVHAVRGTGYRFESPPPPPAEGEVTVLMARGATDTDPALWRTAAQVASASGGYLASAGASGLQLVFADRPAAMDAYEALVGAVRDVRAAVVTGAASRFVHPRSGRYVYVGTAVRLAERRLQAVLPHQAAQRVSAA